MQFTTDELRQLMFAVNVREKRFETLLAERSGEWESLEYVRNQLIHIRTTAAKLDLELSSRSDAEAARIRKMFRPLKAKPKLLPI